MINNSCTSDAMLQKMENDETMKNTCKGKGEKKITLEGKIQQKMEWTICTNNLSNHVTPISGNLLINKEMPRFLFVLLMTHGLSGNLFLSPNN